MEVRIQAIHFDASERLQDFIQKKVAKLEKFCDDIKKVEVSLKVVKPETAMNKEAGVKVLALNGEFFAEKVSDTFEESVDVCVDALSKQLIKAKEKLQEFIQKKVAKLEKFCDDIKKVEVSLKVVKPETAMNKEAGIKVLALNNEFFAEKVSDTFEESVDVCVDALSKQLTKAKEKLRGK